MTKLDLGPIGAALTHGDWDTLRGTAPELESMGYATIWVSGGQLNDLSQLTELVNATRNVAVGSAIIPVDHFPAQAVATLYDQLQQTHPGRLVVGLGGAHGPRPLHTLGKYLDHLDTGPPRVPATSRLLAALGPRMLELAGGRAAGALPLLMTPEYTAQARTLLGEDATLVVEHCVVLDTDPARARAAARDVVGPLSEVTGYQQHLRRLGFAEEDIAQLGDRLVDALVAWGDPETIRRRVAEHLDAGADQVALAALPTGGATQVSTAQWRQLAEALIPARGGSRSGRTS